MLDRISDHFSGHPIDSGYKPLSFGLHKQKRSVEGVVLECGLADNLHVLHGDRESWLLGSTRLDFLLHRLEPSET